MATLERLSPPANPPAERPAWSPRRAIAVVLLFAAAIALLQVLQSSSFTNTGQQLQRLEEQRASLTAENHQLQADIAALSSLDRTERAARERLGMIPAVRLEYISVAVPSPSGPLLPRPLLSPQPQQPQAARVPWWRSLLDALPFR